MVEGPRAKQAFTVDLTKVSRLAAERAYEYASAKISCRGTGHPGPLADGEGACEYFTYGWLKAVSEQLAALHWPVTSAYILPSTEGGDSQVADVVLIVENGSAAFNLVCESLETQYAQAARQQGFVSLVKFHVVAADQARLGMALGGGLHSPALQVWP